MSWLDGLGCQVRSFRHLEVGAQLFSKIVDFQVWRPTFLKFAFLAKKAFFGQGGPLGVFAFLGVFGGF